MNYVIGLLTFVLFMDCLLMMLLILVQLPKKEAGLGTAFGGGATDALFGAGAGNALTQLTKWSAGIFLGLALLLSALNSTQSTNQGSGVRDLLAEDTTGAAAAPTPAAPVTSNAVVAPVITDVVPAFGDVAPSGAAASNVLETTTVVTNAATAVLDGAAKALEKVESVIKDIPKAPEKK